MRYTPSRVYLFVLLCVTCLVANTFFLQPSSVHATTITQQRQSTISPLVIHTPLFAINNIMWSPDGQRLATANADGILQTWSGGHVLATHFDTNRSIYTHVLGWSKDGRSVISSGYQVDKNASQTIVERWDAITGRTLLTIPTNAQVLQLSPDRTRIAFLEGTLDIKDAVTGRLIRTIKIASDYSGTVQWSPNGTRLLITAYDAKSSITRAEVWNALTGQHVATYYAPSKQSVEALTWSADNQSVFALSSSYPSIVQKWSATTGKVLLTYPLKPNLFTSLGASPDGKSLVLQGYDVLQVWSATIEKLFFSVGGSNAYVTGNTWSPDGTKIVLIGNNYPMQVRVSATGQVLHTYTHASTINAVTWSPDGATLATIDTGVSTWSASADKRLVIIPAHHQFENSVTWSPDGTQIAAEDGATYYTGAWNAQTGENLGDFYFYHEDLSRFSYSNKASVAWSPNGQHVAETRNSAVVVWGNMPVACQSSECAQDGGDHDAPISQIAWSPDSAFLASASLDKTVIVYDVTNQKKYTTYTGHFSPVTSVAWSPDGKLVASGEASGIVAFWNPNTAKTLYYLRLHDQAITSVAWSPDGTRLALASLDGFVTVWNLTSKTVVLSYRVQGGAITSVAWSPDGKAIALAGTDKLVRVWNVTTGQITFVYKGHSDVVQAVAWSPDGTRIASASKDGTLQIWSPM
ncbi:MAG: hypothetical protein NVSMB49_14800 [Ktedonobacteraceae bacterium]